MRALEFFAGIGGFAAAFPNLEITHAIDIDQSAKEVYAANFQHRYSIKEIASLPLSWFADQKADIWWMSPPCTPFTQRGAQRDLHDTRSNALKHLISAVSAIRPRIVCLENVVGFESSLAFQQLHDAWTRVGYSIQTLSICPSQLGWPNRRPRIYCLATFDKQEQPLPPVSKPLPLSCFLDQRITPDSHPSLWIEKETLDRYHDAMDRIPMGDKSAVSACFASSYGKAIVRSGSYLETPWGYRRFSPREIARLLGFEDGFCLLESLTLGRQWHLLGNSLSLPAVRHALSGLIPL